MRTNLREAHAHIAAMGRERAYLDLSACASRDEVIDLVRRRLSEMESRRDPGWVLASSMRPAAWADTRWPTRHELDAISTRPIFLGSFDHHSAALNSAALAAAGFAPTSPDPVGGVLPRDAHGEATGVVLEAAYDAARQAIPRPTYEQWRTMIASALDELFRLGFIEVHDMLAPPQLGPILADLHDAGELRLRVRLYCDWKVLSEEAERAKAYTRPGRVELAGGKLFADGTLNARTAWMLTPYRTPLPGHPTGTPMTTPAELDQALGVCSSRGVELAIHAIGDGAVRACLDAKARQPNARLRIEHAELIDPSDVPRFAELGVVCSVQPCHLLYDIEVLADQCGHVLDRVMPLRSLVGSGLVPGQGLVFGSDVPIVRADPTDSVVAAVLRRRVAGTPAGAENNLSIGKGEAIDEPTAWKGFTVL